MSNTVGTKMGARHLVWRATRITSLTALLGLAACTSLLGIEDVHEGPAPGSPDAGSSGSNSSGAGADSHPGGGPNAGSGGDAGDSQLGNAGASETGGTNGTAGTTGAAGTSGSAGSGGTGATGSKVVGHVIDYWGHTIPDVPVEIGGKVATTNADGAFTIDGVAAEYDVSFLIRFDSYGTTRLRGWVFQGLTRRDPTLQVYEGLEDKEAALDIQPNNPSTLTDARTLTVALGGPDGADTETEVSGAGTDGTDIIWQGPTLTQETAHALIWENDPLTTFPAKFIAYDSALVGLSSTVTAHTKASFDLSADVIAHGNIDGTVAGSGSIYRSNSVFLRFTSNAVMTLLTDNTTTAGFSYLVPMLPSASATFAASDGDILNGQYAVAHKDGLAPGTSMINVSIPVPAKTLAVNPSTDINKVSATTQFSFKAGGTTAAPFVAVFSNDGQNSDDRLYIVSTKAPFTLPKVVNGMYAMQPGAPYDLRIETHGSLTNLDAMAGPSGFLDSFSGADYADQPTGPRTGDGSFTISSALNVKIAP